MTPDVTMFAGRPVVVGAGLAGMIAALDLAPTPCVLVTGGELGVDCASDWAQGGLAAAIGPDDSVDRHVADTLAAGAGLCDEDVVRRIVGAGPAVVDHLVSLGARFDRHPDGTLRLGLEGAHSRHRIVHADGDGSGHEITRAVAEAVRRADHVAVLEHCYARRPVLAEGRIAGLELAFAGASGADRAADEVRPLRTSDEDGGGSRRSDTVVLPTRAVVLATGGAGALFAHTTNPRGSWGSGLALGLRAGAAVRDLEMVQFHPTALDAPPATARSTEAPAPANGVAADGPMSLVSEAVRGASAHLVDDLGRRVIDDDLAARDVVSRAVWSRLERGRRVYLDTPSALGESFPAQFPTITAKCAAAGLDPSVDLLPVRPAAHYHMGGLLVDEHNRTTVPGLWAIGEVASTGLHGANRLASNSLLEAVVTGREAAADVRRAVRDADPRATLAALAAASSPSTGGPGGDDLAAGGPAAVRSSGAAWTGPTPEDRTTLEWACGVLRDEARLLEAVHTLRPGAEDHDARLVALLLAWSAYRRTESRGGHFRTDHPRAAAPTHVVLTMADALAEIDGIEEAARIA